MLSHHFEKNISLIIECTYLNFSTCFRLSLKCRHNLNYVVQLLKKTMVKGHATRNDIVDDIVDVSSSTMAFNVAKIVSARASLTISLTKSLRVAGP